MLDMEVSTHLPRPKGLPAACSDEAYYLAARAWAGGRPDREIASLLGVPVGSLHRFVTSKEWYTVVGAVREEYENYDIVALVRLHSLALRVVADALDRGDPYVDFKTGEVRYKRLTGRDAASIASTLADQRELARKRGQDMPDDTDARDELANIALALKELARQGKEKSLEHRTIDITPTQANEADTTGTGGDRA